MISSLLWDFPDGSFVLIFGFECEILSHSDCGRFVTVYSLDWDMTLEFSFDLKVKKLC